MGILLAFTFKKCVASLSILLVKRAVSRWVYTVLIVYNPNIRNTNIKNTNIQVKIETKS